MEPGLTTDLRGHVGAHSVGAHTVPPRPEQPAVSVLDPLSVSAKLVPLPPDPARDLREIRDRLTAGQQDAAARVAKAEDAVRAAEKERAFWAEAHRSYALAIAALEPLQVNA